MMRLRGFTLIEVLVALAIVAFGLAGSFQCHDQTARASSYLREKTFAQWIALNRITEARLAGQPPADDDMKVEIEVRWAGLALGAEDTEDAGQRASCGWRLVCVSTRGLRTAGLASQSASWAMSLRRPALRRRTGSVSQNAAKKKSAARSPHRRRRPARPPGDAAARRHARDRTTRDEGARSHREAVSL